MIKNNAIGSSFDSFLEEENILVQTEAVASKRVFVYKNVTNNRKNEIVKDRYAKTH